MFETLPTPKLDGIIGLMQAFAADTRTDKIDLGVGVYRDAEGRTPVMRAVKQAEARILDTQDSKSYLSLAGDAAFLTEMETLLLGGAVPSARVAAVGTPGGTSAVRQICELIAKVRPGATVWVSAQTWPNHGPLIAAAGLTARPYRYLDAEAGALDRAGMMTDLAQAQAGEVVLLHGCCHNPTGVDLSAQDWAEVAALLERSGATPFVDMAYQGFGEGLDADAGGLRHLAARLPEVLIAASCSKNFGLYRDRVGIAMAVVPDAQRDAMAATLAGLNRQSFAFPPDHGGRVVSTILGDPMLRAVWLEELDGMRARVQENRRALANALREATGSDRMGAVAAQQGMFSILPLTEAQVTKLREDHGIYMLWDGRVNMAGMDPSRAGDVARAVAGVLRG
ncbi:MAG: aromatic-amino-acid transaminase TyrB [Roseibaca calidilacus]|uniref:Aminotransferase n=1 Tax=Roseibaca calidilacus TaxID=1666912 RepID=A0A0P7WU19_9RHOB|nr:amino acid aminotransferase [Roseibaca calidilacus]KPP94515.1 MAG: aromatic-amino-acid transaminase TyrB [Roseibaca calidilacus]CUX83156.1 aromatic amino acid aminotransferase apoenzyme [Roseibaca calidilacus]